MQLPASARSGGRSFIASDRSPPTHRNGPLTWPNFFNDHVNIRHRPLQLRAGSDAKCGPPRTGTGSVPAAMAEASLPGIGKGAAGTPGPVSGRRGRSPNAWTYGRGIPLPSATAGGSPNRLLCPDPVRHMSVISGSVERATVPRSHLHHLLERVVDAGVRGASLRSERYNGTQYRSMRKADRRVGTCARAVALLE
jgi:hypothetical protein